MKTFLLPESERNQIINFLENCTVPANVGATLVNFSQYLKNLKTNDASETTATDYTAPTELATGTKGKHEGGKPTSSN